MFSIKLAWSVKIVYTYEFESELSIDVDEDMIAFYDWTLEIRLY